MSPSGLVFALTPEADGFAPSVILTKPCRPLPLA